ncbi:MAG: hypothetical protein WD533_09245 [Dehalococcoidia bacterium]
MAETRPMQTLLTLDIRAAVARLLLAAGFVLAFAGCGLLSEPGHIAFVVGDEGARDIAVVSPAEGASTQVVSHPSDDYRPVWSPDHRRMAFLSDRDGNPEIYVAQSNGSRVLRTTNTEVTESHVIWSPDSQRLAYVSPDHRGVDRVFWFHLSDLLPKRLEFSTVGETDPAWSPDGEWIAFVPLDENGESLGIRLRNPDGVNQIRVSDGPDWSPVWSPDGRKLAFVSLQEGQRDIYVVPMDEEGPTGDARRVTNDPADDWAPAWSSDSRRVGFLSERDGNTNIYTVSERGTDLQSITQSNVDELGFAYGPDGRIVFESAPDGSSNIFLAERDGSQRDLTDGSAPASQPDW